MALISSTPTTERTKGDYQTLRLSWVKALLVVSITERFSVHFPCWLTPGTPITQVSPSRDSNDDNIEVKGYLFNLFKSVPLVVKQTFEKALYIDPEEDRLRPHIEEQARLVCARIGKAQFGVWYRPSNSPSPRRTFSVEHERNFLSNFVGYTYST
jgi:hypothetical protein